MSLPEQSLGDQFFDRLHQLGVPADDLRFEDVESLFNEEKVFLVRRRPDNGSVWVTMFCENTPESFHLAVKDLFTITDEIDNIIPPVP